MLLEHNSIKKIYREPHGAVPCESEITLRLTVCSNSIPTKVICNISGNEIPMYYSFDLSGSRVYECKFTLSEIGLFFYFFYVETDGECAYYGNNSMHLGGLGEMLSSPPENLYQITVFNKDFKTPDWVKNAIIYQIFPDRFCRKGNTPFHGIERNWFDEPFYRPDQFGGEYLSNDFFGGNFKGIESKLSYLSELGVTAIYLNPISKAFSNHRYDTGDYTVPDETLGTTEHFKELCKSAEKHGIKVVLDGVFSHTGADSKYFNKYGNYSSVGAYQSKSSPYFSWYSFSDFPEKYNSWWGFETLPNVNELDENYTDFVVNSVIKHWLKCGASGWRLDVADELPDEFISILRKAIKKENENALLLGEVWEDASNKISYGKRRNFLLGDELDSVMNYVFREAVLDFLTSCNAQIFSMRIESIYENYPKQSLYACMNMLSSHDVPRALTVLSGAPDFRTLDRQTQHDYKISPEALNLAEKRMVLAIALQMTMPGAPCIYYGDEVGLFGYADPFNRAPFPWDKKSDVLTMQIKQLANLRHRNICLRTGFYQTLYYYNGIICYMRSTENGFDVFGKKTDDSCIITIINSSDKAETIELDLMRFSVSGISDALSGEKYEYNGKLKLTLYPYSYRMFKLERNGTKCIKIPNTQ